MIGSGAEVVDKMFVDNNNFLFAFEKRRFVCDSCMYMVGMYVCMRTKMPGTKSVETKEDEKEDEEDDDDDDSICIPPLSEQVYKYKYKMNAAVHYMYSQRLVGQVRYR